MIQTVQRDPGRPGMVLLDEEPGAPMQQKQDDQDDEYGLCATTLEGNTTWEAKIN